MGVTMRHFDHREMHELYVVTEDAIYQINDGFELSLNDGYVPRRSPSIECIARKHTSLRTPTLNIRARHVGIALHMIIFYGDLETIGKLECYNGIRIPPEQDMQRQFINV